MKRMKRTAIVFAFALAMAGALIFAGISLSSPNQVRAEVTDEDISNAQAAQDEAQQKLAAVKEKVSSLQGQSSELTSSIADLDTQIADFSAQITSMNQQISAKESQIDDAQASLEAAQASADDQYQSMKLRIRFMYENGDDTYISVLLNSSDMQDMLNRAEYIQEITAYDRQQLIRYQETVQLIADTKTELENDYTALDSMRASLEDNKQSVELLQSAKNKQLVTVTANLEDEKANEQELEAESASAQSMLATLVANKDEQARQLEEARKQKEAAANAQAKLNESTSAASTSGTSSSSTESGSTESGNSSGNSSSSSGSSSSGSSSSGSSSSGSNSGSQVAASFIWPTVSHRVTTQFHEWTGVKWHEGIDVGAVTPGVSGDSVWAMADGIVVTSGWDPAGIARGDGGGGQWIWIYHGDYNGVPLYSVYMHASVLEVSVGDYVTQGQEIMKMGSTGNSTAAHLHFGFYVNGDGSDNARDPADYGVTP